jgi:hypothetical protein
MRSLLPRELKDMIYMQIWDYDAIKEHNRNMEPRAQYKCTCQVCTNVTGETCRNRWKLPDFIKPESEGPETAREIVEAWYKTVIREADDPDDGGFTVELSKPSEFEHFVGQDAVAVGVISAEFLRRLEISVKLEDLFSQDEHHLEENASEGDDPHEDASEEDDLYGDNSDAHGSNIDQFNADIPDSDIPDAEMADGDTTDGDNPRPNAFRIREQQVESLLNIKRKAGFELVIDLWQRRIQLDLWPYAFDVLRPILIAFEAEGASVRVFCSYVHWESSDDGKPPIPKWDCNQLYKACDPNWKRDVIVYIDEVSAILPPLWRFSDLHSTLPIFSVCGRSVLTSGCSAHNDQ